MCATPDPGSLLLYREFGRAELTRAVARLAAASAEEGRLLYAEVFARLAAQTSTGDPWRRYVCRAVLTEETPYSITARASGTRTSGLARAMEHDLRILQRLAAIDGDALARALSADEELPSWRALGSPEALVGLEAALETASDWTTLEGGLWEHFRTHSAGAFARHRAFRFDADGLHPVPNPDPVRLAELVGYEQQQAPLVENTEILMRGRRANNALLHGPRGTGKSSTVKALINEFGDRGLRLIQLDKSDLRLFSSALLEARDRPERFVFFIDDLAYDLGESEYGHLKALLEGGLERRPDNAVVYATSNRRNVVDERFGDRDGAGDPVHVTDLHQHKLSLADRFGLRIAFPPVDQAGYLVIVGALAARLGLAVNEDLEAEAIRWSLRHNGVSPRTAQHFVDHAAGRAALAED